MESSVDESSLILKVVHGDPQAWELLIQVYQEAVFRYGYLILGDPHDAEDIAQEVFLRAYRALPTFDIHRPFRPWLLTITANLARNRQRSAGRYLSALQRWFYSRGEQESSIEETTFQHIQSGTLWAALRRLSLDDQQVIYLRYFLDLSIDETAAAANIATGTVKSRLHRALKRLKVILDREFPDLAGQTGTES